MFSTKSVSKKWIIAGAITILVIVSLIFFLNTKMPGIFQKEVNLDEYFGILLERAVVNTYGETVTGYDPSMLIGSTRGLMNEDFNLVETDYGKYEIINGGISFRPTKKQKIKESMLFISKDGMETLLENISERLGIKVSNKESVEKILNEIK